MPNLLDLFPTILLMIVLVLTLVLLPLLAEERPNQADRQRTDRLRLPFKRDQ